MFGKDYLKTVSDRESENFGGELVEKLQSIPDNVKTSECSGPSEIDLNMN